MADSPPWDLTQPSRLFGDFVMNYTSQNTLFLKLQAEWHECKKHEFAPKKAKKQMFTRLKTFRF